jgi:hypothetical protein
MKTPFERMLDCLAAWSMASAAVFARPCKSREGNNKNVSKQSIDKTTEAMRFQ